jgi:hypothetical protein
MGSFNLNFSKNRLITAANIVDNVLYFTDNKTEPKRINIDVFKAADHSNGTTSVYGRQFLERDITVIRPHPQAVIQTRLSQELTVPIDASEPEVITNRADVLAGDLVRLNGNSISGGTAFTARGFFYYELDSTVAPSIATILSANNKVEADVNGNFFSEEVQFTQGKKYYYIAFAKTQIGTAVYGNPVAFRTTDIVTDFPTVKTVGHEKISNNRYKLKGNVSDEGGSRITEVGIYYYFLNFLDTSTPPSTLVGEFNGPISGAQKATAEYDEDTGNFSIDIGALGGTLLYYQAYAVNYSSGQDEGNVNNQTFSGGEGPALRFTSPDINTSSVIIRAEITRANGNIQERGFYFSKETNSEIVMVGGHTNNPNIFKVSVPMTENTHLDEYIFDTLDESNISLNPGDTIHAIAYASNQFLETRTGVLSLTMPDISVVVTDEDEDDDNVDIINRIPPSVITESVTVITDGGNSKIRLTGNNTSPTAQSVQELGFYVTRQPIGESLGVDQAAKQAEMVSRFNAHPQTATSIKSTRGQLFLAGQANTDPGPFIIDFSGDNIVPIEPGFEYYGMAIASAAGLPLGKGKVLSTPTKTAEDGPKLYTKKAYNITETSATLVGAVEFDNDSTVRNAVVNAGFTISAGGAAGLEIIFHQISASDLADLNTFITTGVGSTGANNSVPVRDFSVNVTGLQDNTQYHVKSYVELASGTKVYANPTAAETYAIFQGITDFKTLAPGPSLPVITCSTGNIGRNTAYIRGNLLQGDGSNKSFLEMKPVFYYSKVSAVAVSGEDQIRANIISSVDSAGTSTSTLGKAGGSQDLVLAADIPQTANEVNTTLGGTDEFLASPPPAVPLDIDTEYYVFVVTSVSNGSTEAESFGGLGPGKAISNLVKFKTEAAAATPYIINPVVVSDIEPTTAWFKASKVSDGGNRDWGNGLDPTKIIGFYYIKKSDLPASYDPNNALTAAPTIAASSDKLYLSENDQRFGGNSLSKAVTGLEANTEYYVIGAIENGIGIGYSTTATLFKTKEEAVRNTLIMDGGFRNLDFDSNGNLMTRLGHVSISPPDASVIVDWEGNWSPYSTDQVIPRVENAPDGSSFIRIIVPRNRSSLQRHGYVTISHSKDSSLFRRIKITQWPGSSGYSGGGDVVRVRM